MDLMKKYNSLFNAPKIFNIYGVNFFKIKNILEIKFIKSSENIIFCDKLIILITCEKR